MDSALFADCPLLIEKAADVTPLFGIPYKISVMEMRDDIEGTVKK